MRLIARNLERSFRRRKVVRDVSLELQSGEIVGLLGPNGAGKTTVFYMLVGLIPPGRGEIFLDDRNITNMPMYRRARLGIGYLPQEPSVFRKLNVEDNILAILDTLELPASERQFRLEGLLNELNIAHLAKTMAFALSGGERRRVEITRALATQPNFLLLDEPFAGIDPIAIIDIQKIIRQLKEKGIGILITDHNVQETLEITERSYIINEGEILETGTSLDIANSSRAKAVYLGEKFRLQEP